MLPAHLFLLLLLLCNMHGNSNLTTTSVACPPGRGGVSCSICVAGTYKSTWGFDVCSICPTGTVSAVVGATSASTCTVCVEGTFASTDHVECIFCPAYTQSPAGASSIVECLALPGYYATPGMTGVICPAGMYCPATIMKPIPCAAGLFSVEGSSECSENDIVNEQSYTMHVIVLITWVVFLGIACVCVFVTKSSILNQDNANNIKFIHVRI